MHRALVLETQAETAVFGGTSSILPLDVRDLRRTLHSRRIPHPGRTPVSSFHNLPGQHYTRLCLQLGKTIIFTQRRTNSNSSTYS